MADFAKTFTVRNGEQVLVYHEYDSEEDQYKLHYILNLPTVRVTLDHVSKSEQTILTTFQGINQDSIQNEYDHILESFLKEFDLESKEVSS